MRTSRIPSAAARGGLSASLRRAAHVAVPAIALLLAGCRADGITTPEQTTDTVCRSICGPDGVAPAPNAAIVIAPLEDAAARIVPHMMDARARTDLGLALDLLRRELLAGRLSTARIALARAYDAVDMADARLDTSADVAVVLDLADISAIRLALVPASTALGVTVP